MTQERILIVGTGAMASLFAARLSQHAEVTMLGTWKEGLAALEARGLLLAEADGTEETYPVHATDNPEDCAGSLHALVFVKSWQTSRAARQLTECLDPEGVALTLQNGLGNLETLLEALGENRAALGVTTTGAAMVGPGHVRVGGVGTTHVALHSRLEPLINLLRKAGFMVEVAEDLEALVWGKLAVNAAINPLTALLGIPNGELLARPHALALMDEAAQEAADVAYARGVKFPFEDPGAVAVDVAGRTASNISSMLQDIQRGAPTEIDAMCGAIALEGESLGVMTSVNRTLWHLVRALAISATGVEP
jgi:2-dehydropantoate 2-reductase